MFRAEMKTAAGQCNLKTFLNLEKWVLNFEVCYEERNKTLSYYGTASKLKFWNMCSFLKSRSESD